MRRPVVAIPILLLCLAGALPAQCPDGTPPPCGGAVRTTPAPTSVAVLYFENGSRDSADAYLADGLTDQIIDRLDHVGRLQVVSRAATRGARNQAAVDAVGAARHLGCAWFVSGNVRRSGNRLRVDVELVRTSTGVRAWGRVIDQADADPFAIEEQVARQVAEAIMGRLAPGEREALHRAAPPTPAAYDHILRGNYYLARRNADDAWRAVEEYQAAAQLEASYGSAFGRIGIAYGVIYGHGWTRTNMDRDSIAARAFLAVNRALAIDSSTADAWTARAVLLPYARPPRYEAARAAAQRAIALDPRNPEAWHIYGFILMDFWGEVDSAVVALRRALALDPGRPVTMAYLGYLEYLTRRYASAAALMDSVAASGTPNPELQLQSRIALLQGDTSAAGRSAGERIRTAPRCPYSDRGVLLLLAATAGDTAGVAAQRSVLEGSTCPVRERGDVAMRAAVRVALNDRNGALTLLEGEDPTTGTWRELDDPLLDPLRSEPRFQRLERALRPTPGWR
jgi:TolB-like protein